MSAHNLANVIVALTQLVQGRASDCRETLERIVRENGGRLPEPTFDEACNESHLDGRWA